MEIQILKETPDWLVINKPAGIVVHDVPGEKHAGETIVDWLIENFPVIKKEHWQDQSRPGIVHRLDAETSGLLIVAKNQKTLTDFQQLFKNREVKKTYVALVAGDTLKQGELTGYIVRKEGTTAHELKLLDFPWDKGKDSFTEFERINFYEFTEYPLSLLKLFPKTGRTHQLRVQLFHAGWPILGDKIYKNKLSEELSQKIAIKRHLLHAKNLAFNDPKTVEKIELEAPIAEDFLTVLDKLHQIH